MNIFAIAFNVKLEGTISIYAILAFERTNIT